MAMKKDRPLIKRYPKPRSLCTCGHKGEGPKSEHRGRKGNGACLVKGCECIEFTWASFLPEYLRDYANMTSD